MVLFIVWASDLMETLNTFLSFQNILFCVVVNIDNSLNLRCKISAILTLCVLNLTFKTTVKI